MENQKFDKKSDQSNCTFWWDINLNKNLPENKITLIRGYGKFQNDNERKCKKTLLMKHVEMFTKYPKDSELKYLHRCESIEIYERKGLLPNKTSDTLILTIFPNLEYEVNSNLLVADFFDENLKHLKDFFSGLKNGKIKYLRPLNAPRKKDVFGNEYSKDDDFNIMKQYFTNLNQLIDYCTHKIKLGANREIVGGFYKKYIEKYEYRLK